MPAEKIDENFIFKKLKFTYELTFSVLVYLFLREKSG